MYRDRETDCYAALKARLFSPQAQADGLYAKRPRPFCLADGYAHENLHASIRHSAMDYAEKRGIPWHDGRDG